MTPRTQNALAAGTITEVPWTYKNDYCSGCRACEGPGELGECLNCHFCDECGLTGNFHFRESPFVDPMIYFDQEAERHICHECIDGYLAEAGTAKEKTP